MFRSLSAILSGILTLSITSFAIEVMLPSRTADQSIGATLFEYLYTSLCVVAGGYVTAWVAQRSPVRHALIMGAIQAALVIPAMLANPGLAPTYHWIIGMVLIVPAAWCGGKLRERATVRPKSA